METKASTNGQPKNVHEAIAAVMETVKYVQKTGHIDQGGKRYSYAGEGDLIGVVRPEMVKHGLVLYVTDIQDLGAEWYETRSGNKRRIVRAIIRGLWVHAPSGTSQVVAAIGGGADEAEKAEPKCQTGGFKYLLRNTVCLETGDDPDNDASEERAAHQPKAGLPETGGTRGQGDGLPRKRPAPDANKTGDRPHLMVVDGGQIAEYPKCPQCGKFVETTRKAGENAARPGEAYYNCWSKDGCKAGFLIYVSDWEKALKQRREDYQLWEKAFAACPFCGEGMTKQETDGSDADADEQWFFQCPSEECEEKHGRKFHPAGFRGWTKAPGGAA